MSDFSIIKTLFNLKSDNGFSPDEISVHQKICPQIPKVLADYYAQLGKVHELNHTQDQLLTPDKLCLSECGEYLLFYMENQAVCGWGIRVGDLTQDDPAVFISYDGQEWLADHDRLSEFLHGMAFLQGVFGLAFASEEFLFINDKELAFIKDNFAQKPYGLNVWSVAFYGDDKDVIAVFNDDGKYNLAYASNNEQGFGKLDQVLGELGE